MSIEFIAVGIFIFGYALITLEHRLMLHKSFTAAALGGILWLLIGIKEGATAQHALEPLGSDIFGLVTFLLAAMTLVEILTHYGFFDFIRIKLLRLRLNDYRQLWVVAGIAFFLSPVLDNLTTTIVMTQIALRFFRGRNLVIVAATIVIAANAGGAFSPIGDVTTIMLWLAGKFSATEVIRAGFLPSLSMLLVGTWLLARGLRADTRDIKEERVTFSKSEGAVVAVAIGSFSLPLIFSSMGLAPYLGLLTGLGVIGLLITLLRIVDPAQTHLDVDIEKLLARVKFASLLFFTGILLAVGALAHLGVLERISENLFGENPELWRFIAGNVALGLLSAVMDNIPLTAAAIEILQTTDPALWVLLAITVGTGGSMLVIGSAAGVIIMDTVKELTFFRYLKVATVPALLGYLTAVAVWFTQYQLFFS